jgi:hypothetical protein
MPACVKHVSKICMVNTELIITYFCGTYFIGAIVSFLAKTVKHIYDFHTKNHSSVNNQNDKF